MKKEFTHYSSVKQVLKAVDMLNEDLCKPKQPKKRTEDTAHELWAAAQLLPDEGIEDAVKRIMKILSNFEKEVKNDIH